MISSKAYGSKQKREARRWFKEWSNDYDRTLGKMARHHALLDLAVKLARPKDGEQILDVGCGTGLLTLKFLKAADCSVTAVDSSCEMLAIFQKKIETLRLKRRATCKEQDAASLSFQDNCFDIVASTVALHHVKDKLPMVKKIFRILRSGGRFALGDIDLDTTGRITDPKRLRRVMDYLKDELTMALEDGGPEALSRMFDNGKKHLFNDGEYAVDFSRWANLCKQAGFGPIALRPLREFKRFKVLVAYKA
ncbi:MAG: class I SAM-dependent methyltransferase [Deltaproteobacteria bacterium]|nr:class I SAM-dependent methyltransferase [Deltaproteobacteria bacterium]